MEASFDERFDRSEKSQDESSYLEDDSSHLSGSTVRWKIRSKWKVTGWVELSRGWLESSKWKHRSIKDSIEVKSHRMSRAISRMTRVIQAEAPFHVRFDRSEKSQDESSYLEDDSSHLSGSTVPWKIRSKWKVTGWVELSRGWLDSSKRKHRSMKDSIEVKSHRMSRAVSRMTRVI